MNSRMVGVFALCACGRVLAANSDDPVDVPLVLLHPAAVQIDRRGTAEQPIVVAVPRVPVVKVEGRFEREKEKTNFFSAEWWLVYLTGALALYTGLLFRATVRLGRDAKESSATQAAMMQASVKEASRAAVAMEDVAKGTRENAAKFVGLQQKQFRAYITIDIGNAEYQDQNLKFAGYPIVNNTGLTPARNVCYKTIAAVLPTNIPADFEFPDAAPMKQTDQTITPRQTFVLAGVVPDRLPDGEVDEVMDGVTRRLWIWGKVEYDDIFEDHHETNYCYSVFFLKYKDGKVIPRGTWYVKHNVAT